MDLGPLIGTAFGSFVVAALFLIKYLPSLSRSVAVEKTGAEVMVSVQAAVLQWQALHTEAQVQTVKERERREDAEQRLSDFMLRAMKERESDRAIIERMSARIDELQHEVAKLRQELRPT